MFGTITSFFESCLKTRDTDSQEHAADKLHLACAALMLELCHADQHMHENEKQALRDILRKTFTLDEKALDTLWSLANQAARQATSVFQFTSLINASYSYEEKTRLLGHMWEIAYADGELDRYEDHFIRKVADLLYLTHGDFIRAKLANRPAQGN